ncbi:MAG: TIGR00304 family membrane protein [Candidatus Aenigmatarchaeota archaeon]
MEVQTNLLGLLIVLIGIFLVLLGGILILLQTKQAKVEGGFIVWVGPFPLALTTSKEMFYFLLIFSLIFIFALILFYFIKR